MTLTTVYLYRLRDHAKEMGGPIPTTPMFFLKPTSSYLRQPHSIEIPKGTIVHHEGIARDVDLVYKTVFKHTHTHTYSPHSNHI